MSTLKYIRLRRRPGPLPIFDIVVSSKYKRSKGDFVERVGFYHPIKGSRVFSVNFERIGFLLNKGVKLHSSVKKYLTYFAVVFLSKKK
jgi:ribosomal protein S16